MILVFPILIFVLLHFPEHEVSQYLFQEGRCYFLGCDDLLLVGNAVLIGDDKVGNEFGQIHKRAGIKFEMWKYVDIFGEVVANGVVDFGDFGYVEPHFIFDVEIFLELRPSLVYEHDVFLLPMWLLLKLLFFSRNTWRPTRLVIFVVVLRQLLVLEEESQLKYSFVKLNIQKITAFNFSRGAPIYFIILIISELIYFTSTYFSYKSTKFYVLLSISESFLTIFSLRTEWFCSLVQSKSFWAFLFVITMLVIIGANPPSMLRKPFKKAAAVLMHLPSSEEYVFKSCL